MLRTGIAFITAALLNISGIGAARADCVWEGKAPLCNGKCKTGFKLIKEDKEGDGKKCATGVKALCCPDVMVVVRGKAPACNGKCEPGETRVGDSDTGEGGKKCLTGKAAQCINPVTK